MVISLLLVYMNIQFLSSIVVSKIVHQFWCDREDSSLECCRGALSLFELQI